jgi:putrescine aminotransferase
MKKHFFERHQRHRRRMKLARMYTGKSGFISAIHGKSYGALSLMGKAEYRTPFEPLLQDV